MVDRPTGTYRRSNRKSIATFASGPSTADHRGFPLFRESENVLVGSTDLGADELAAIDDESQFPAELMAPKFADGLPRSAAHAFTSRQPSPSIAGGPIQSER